MSSLITGDCQADAIDCPGLSRNQRIERAEQVMWRAFFLAAGIFCCILGAECLLIDKAVVVSGQARTVPGRAIQAVNGRYREVVPAPWFPWTLLSTGAVIILYCYTLPKKMHGG